jgi:hypothetical protein
MLADGAGDALIARLGRALDDVQHGGSPPTGRAGSRSIPVVPRRLRASWLTPSVLVTTKEGVFARLILEH